YAGRPAAMINEALSKEPENPKALWLAGMMNFQNGDHAQAIQNWTLLRERVQDGSEDAEMLDAFIARATGHKPEDIITAQNNGSQPEPIVANTDSQSATTTGITVLVTLDPRLTGSARAEDTVFVFARAVGGPPMPLAIVRKQVKDLPFKATLDDSQAMMPDMMLTRFPEVVIGARISKSGNATAQSGDLQGISDVIATDTDKPVSIVIDQVVP
ncbi:MAG: c-type cytochrome biogenesis protein CcmI, partial [Gammaproteobacteria bacterium]